MLNIVLFGPPGAGKGTQSEKVKKEYSLVHLSTGDMLRKEMGAETDLGNLAKSYINAGQLVPDEVVIGMIGKQLEQHKEGGGFIFDGFPRTVEQAQALDELLKGHNTSITGMVELKVPHDELKERLLLRGATSGRTDDNAKTIEKRITEYEKKTAPVAEFYGKQSKHVAVDGVGPIDRVFERIKDAVEELSA